MIWIALAILLAALILRVPSRYERAQTLKLLADEKAALVYSQSPASPWPTLQAQVTRLIIATRTTRSRYAIEAAAAAALIRLGVKVPNAR